MSLDPPAKPVEAMNPAPPAAPVAGVRGEFLRGLLYVHSRLNVNTGEALEALASVSALVDMLIAKGIISAEELEQSRQAAAQLLAARFSEKGLGVVLQMAVEDKYAFPEEVVIDCASRVDLCHAACCRLRFALSKQDVREGIVRWKLEEPYMIAQEPDGCCSHLRRDSKSCAVWTNRPAPCRAYDCRRDKRIWVDFNQRIPNPALARPDWPQCVPVPDGAGPFDMGAMESMSDPAPENGRGGMEGGRPPETSPQGV